MRILKLILGSLLIVFVWTWVLPRVARTPAVQKHIRFLDDHNINAGAMFYTEVQEHR